MSYLVTPEMLRGEGLPDDGRAEMIADWAEAYVERETGFSFRAQAASFLVDGSGSATLTLPQPIISISSLTVGGVALAEGTDYLAMKRRPPDADDRRWPRLVIPTPSPSSTFLTGSRLGNVWTLGVQNVAVAGTFGFTRLVGTSEVAPEEIERAALRLVALELARLGDAKEATAQRVRKFVTSFTAGALSSSLSSLAVSAGPTHVPEVDAVLDAFRHPTRSARPPMAFA